MTPAGRWTRLLRTELQHLLAVTPSDRRWQMPFAAALASGLPVLVGASLGHLDHGLIASLGGLVFLHLPATPLHHRMLTIMACSFAMSACYALGVLSHFVPALMMPVLTFIAILVTMVCRFYAMGMPGSLFFVMAAAIGAYSPMDSRQVPLAVGLVSMGTLLACLIAFFYSVLTLRRQPPQPVPALPPASFDFVVFDAVVIGLCVGISLVLAQALRLDNAYWVPVSCLAVIQGASMRAVWNKQVHRIVGTGIGLLVSLGILLLPLDGRGIALVMMMLTFIVETTVVRHYAVAAVFITPLTILLADAGALGGTAPGELIQARFADTVLGCLVGLAGGACLHSPRFREIAGRPLRRLFP